MSATRAAELAAKYDVYGQRRAKGGVRLELVLTRGERARSKRSGVRTTFQRVKGGKTVKQFAAAQAANGFTVWRSWDEPGGFRDQMHAVARNNPQLAKLVQLGDDLPGPRDPRAQADPGRARHARRRRPAVLYSSTAARARVDRQRGQPAPDELVHRPLARERPAGQAPAQGRPSCGSCLVANPDGYQYTFDVERLWRKNLRDNDGDGEITIGDGVDPNRNFPNHFKYDEEGSSSIFSSETYRGPAAGLGAGDAGA